MAFPERFLDELTERNDIVDVVSQYVRLTKKSGANLFGLCPFHSEKTMPDCLHHACCRQPLRYCCLPDSSQPIHRFLFLLPDKLPSFHNADG